MTDCPHKNPVTIPVQGDESMPVKSITLCQDCGEEVPAQHLLIYEKKEDGLARKGKGLTPAMLREPKKRDEIIKPVNRKKRFKPEPGTSRNNRNSLF